MPSNIQSQVRNLAGGVFYKFCVHAKLGAGSPATARITVNMMSNVTSNVVPLATASAQLDTVSFQRVCVFTCGPIASARRFFTVRMGAVAAVYLFDDVTIESIL